MPTTCLDFRNKRESFELSQKGRFSIKQGWLPEEWIMASRLKTVSRQYGWFQEAFQEKFFEYIRMTLATTLAPATEGLMALCEDLIERSERFPVSYNQSLIRGSLRYCSRIVGRMEKQDNFILDLYKKVKNYAQECRRLLEDYNAPLHKMDLQHFEDHFEIIQTESADSGLLPKLDDLKLGDILVS